MNSSSSPALPSPAHPAADSVAKPVAKPLWRIFLAFLVPMILSNFLQSLSGTVNGIFIGQMLGVKALAAVTVMFPVLFFFIAFIIGLGAGASVLIGQAWGAQKVERVQAVVGTALTAGVLFGLLVALCGFLFADNLMRALGTPADILADATAYAHVMALAVPGLFLFLLITSMLRGVGDTLSPLMTLLVSTGVGLIVTPALIRGWGGLPQLGIASSAWGTMVAYAVALLWLGIRLLNKPYRGKTHPMAPNAALLRHLRIEPDVLKGILQIGVPTGLQMVVVALSELAILKLVNGFGSDATAAYGAVNNIINYVQFPAISIAITCSVLGAQSIGAFYATQNRAGAANIQAGPGLHARLGAIVRTGLQMNLAITGGLVLLGYLLSRSIIGLFTHDQGVINLAQELLHIMLWSLLVLGMAGALSGVMRASGSVIAPTLISVGSILLIQIPVANLLARHVGLHGIWFSYPAVFLAMLGLQAAYYRLVWKKKPIQRLI